MNIQLRNMNVVKQVDSEDKAKRLEALGFKRIGEMESSEKETTNDGQETKGASNGKRAASPRGQKGDKKGTQKDEVKSEGGGENAAEPGGTDNGGGDGQPEDG